MAHRFWHLVLVTALLVAAGVASSAAQGVQTGTLSGTVKDQGGLVVPGATVTVSSPSLQGTRSTVTDANGVYTLPGLPPGTYTARFELQGFAPLERTDTVITLGSVTVLDATLGVAALTEEVRVTAEVASILATPTGQMNFRGTEINTLPVGRTPFRIAELAPGLTDNTPNVGQVTISGAFAYDNVFLVDGVDVNDNLFGTANNLFIEDAIDETQILTSGVSAEFGRFSGGVINLVTKQGGNNFSGSLRLNMTNPAWSDESPLEKEQGTEHVDKISQFWEGTLGGPIARDQLWFFAAWRRERSERQWALAQVGTPQTTGAENDRYEIKVTGTILGDQRLQGSFLDNKTQDVNRASLNDASAIDPRVVVTRQIPNRLWVASYNGVLGSRMFVTGQYSEKRFGFRNSGGTSTAVEDSPFRTRGSGIPSGLHYNAPFFSSLDPEDRNNRQFAASLQRIMSAGSGGTHDLKVGGEHYTSSRTGGNSQSATGYVFLADYVTDTQGRPALDAQGRIVPNFVPGFSQVQNWISTQGAKLSIRTLSLYAQDRWTVSDRLTLDLGVRFEDVKSTATGDIIGADTQTTVPRLGLTFDLSGDGQTTVQSTYAHYAGKYAESQWGRNTNVGSPSRVTYSYTGPAGQGFDFAPGLDLANYGAIVSGNFPTANVFFADDLSSPLTKEFTLSLGHSTGRGLGRVMYTWRKATNFIEDFIDDPSPEGKVTVIRDGVNFGTFDRVLFDNADGVERRYQAMQFIGRYRLSDRLTVDGHYTWQIENEGNFEGEAANQPGNPSDFADYPEILRANRNFPDGVLNDFQAHKIRAWATYVQDLGRAGTLTIAPLWKYNSAQSYSLLTASVPLSAVQLARNPGYARLPGGGFQNLYYGERGTERFEGYGVVDLAASYDIPVWQTLRPWIKFELFNVLNNDKLIAWNTAVTPDPNSPLDENGLPTGFIRSAAFGTARNNADYPRPIPGIDGGRTFQVALGFRF